jgi:hypothetical protein
LRGIERFSFRLDIDAASGELMRAATPHDQLDLVVGLPGLDPASAPRVQITREIVIETRAD